VADLTVRAQEALLEQLQEEGSRGEISRRAYQQSQKFVAYPLRKMKHFLHRLAE